MPEVAVEDIFQRPHVGEVQWQLGAGVKANKFNDRISPYELHTVVSSHLLCIYAL